MNTVTVQIRLPAPTGGKAEAALEFPPSPSASSTTSSLITDPLDGFESDFDSLCNSGTTRTWSNLPTRAGRKVFQPVLKPLLSLAMRQSMPTNVSMLMMRAANRAFGRPHANKDWVAEKFFAALEPADAAHLAAPGGPTLYARLRRAAFELPGLGIPGMINFLDARTQWFDARLVAALDAGIDQVVVIAAGFDTTAYRLARPGVKFFEVDLPAASARKRALVDAVLPDAAAYPRPAYVAADLSTVDLADALAGCGFDPARPAFFSCQGLVYYLPPCAVAALLASVRRLAAPGSRLAFDFIRLACLAGKRAAGGLEVMRTAVAARGEPFLSGVDDGEGRVEALARLFGFRCEERMGARQLAAQFLPHLVWREFPAPVQTCFSYAEFAVDA
jgi:methyltransferase (TIGR00027 family)